ncbi:MAG: site-specific DNA-methyltransferase [Lentisphaerae bacterium]|jgi:adenine-specific DNA-methyltransferase|nr:site-specific DNA-methyltransferase [Lentisphaerota bacterium]MBT7913158.1 site-specific DNA-methyltransferase [Candidatus Bathyarchaeota archaeon]
MAKKQKLELTWIGKDEQPQLEPRILIEEPTGSYGDRSAENILIHGDNLLALKALEQDFTEKVQCIYIDPPFNTEQAFEHYDDGVEHSIWLTLMRQRLTVMHRLLHPSGSFFVHIDDNELGYLIAVCDEVFGRKNRVSIITFKQSSSSGPKAVNPGLVTTANYILFYSKDKARWKNFKVFVPTGRDSRYNHYIVNYEEDFSEWHLINLRNALADSLGMATKNLRKHFAGNLESTLEKFVLQEPHRVVRTARVAPKDVNKSARDALGKSVETPNVVFRSQREGKNDYYFLNGEQLLFYSTKAREVNGTTTTAQAATNLWDDILSNNLHKEGQVRFPNGKKPELLLKRILDMSTEAGDWVLDSFLGSGTTSAVAHKMNRRWIGVELRDHAETHCIPRLQNVCDGTDQDGASRAVKWEGGGGFRCYDLAPSLLQKDKRGNWVISDGYNPNMLAAAMAKHEGFKYCPNHETYWKQGQSSEKDFIFTTTSFVQVAFIDRIHEEMETDEHLLICCKKFSAACSRRYPNIEIKKIPKMLLGKCEFGRDDYSLNIVNMPVDGDQPEFVPSGPPKPKRKKGHPNPAQLDLFDMEGQS